MTFPPNEQSAWIVVRQGFPAKAVEFKTDWPVPKKLEQGEVLVRIQAAALNPAYETDLHISQKSKLTPSLQWLEVDGSLAQFLDQKAPCCRIRLFWSYR